MRTKNAQKYTLKWMSDLSTVLVTHWNMRHSWFQRLPISFSLASKPITVTTAAYTEGRYTSRKFSVEFYTLSSTFCFITLSSYLVGKWHKEAFTRERKRRMQLKLTLKCLNINPILKSSHITVKTLYHHLILATCRQETTKAYKHESRHSV